MISINLIPAVLAVIVSVFVIWAARQGKNSSKFFVPMIIVFALFHTTEIAGLVLFNQSHTIENILRLYYVLSLVGLSLISLYASEVAKVKIKGIQGAVVAIALTFALVCVGTDFIIAGVQSIELSLIHI